MAKLSFKDILKNPEPPTYYELLGIIPETLDSHQIQETKQTVRNAVEARLTELQAGGISNPVINASMQHLVRSAGEALGNPVTKIRYDNLLASDSQDHTAELDAEAAQQYAEHVKQHSLNRERILNRPLKDKELPSHTLRTIRSGLKDEDPRAREIDIDLKQRERALAQRKFAFQALDWGIQQGYIVNPVHKTRTDPVYEIPLEGRPVEKRIELAALACRTGLKNLLMRNAAGKEAMQMFQMEETLGVILAGAGIFTENPETGELTFKRGSAFEPEEASNKLGQFLSLCNLMPDAIGTEAGTVVYKGEKASRIKKLIEDVQELAPLTGTTTSWALKHVTSPLFQR